MSFFRELKRRNVFRVGIAYAVAAWVLLQIFDVIGEILELPAWGGKLILAMLIIGFFMALFFAWAFELTPEGVKRESEIDRSQSITAQTGRKLNAAILLLMAVAIAYLLFDKFYLAPRLAASQAAAVQTPAPVPADPPPAAPAAAAPVSRQSIAVLPFDNRSRLEEDEFFVAGIHDDLLTNLARIGSLKVISRTSVNQYRDTSKTIPQIANELGVATVMEGAVQRAGNTVRINVQLIDAQTDEHLWAEIFDRELTADNLFAIQSEISGEIAKALQATLSPEDRQRLDERPTENLAAYNAYLRGRQLMARRNSEDVDQAAQEFQRAVDLDPGFALAWVGIADTALLQFGYSNLDARESYERQQMAVDRALAIDGQLGEAYLVLAQIHDYYAREEQADAAFRKAIELSPGYATAYQWYANFLNRFPQRLDESVQLRQRALELDPLSSIIRLNLADHYVLTGQFDEAGRQYDQLLELDPEFATTFISRAVVAAELGRFDEQIRWLQRAIEMDPGRLATYFDLAWAFADIDDLEPLEGIKRRMAEINDQHAFLAITDVVSNLHGDNYGGALEAARWMYDRMNRPPFVLRILGYIQTMQRDYPAARESFATAEPRLFDRDRWRAAIEANPDDACLVGWLLARTGDEPLGADLVAATLDYLENELPRYIEHADRRVIEACYLAAGDQEKALTAIETRAAHGHNAQWWLMRKQPMYEPLWGDPRFEAVLRKIQDGLVIQRANLARMETAANLP